MFVKLLCLPESVVIHFSIINSYPNRRLDNNIAAISDRTMDSGPKKADPTDPDPRIQGPPVAMTLDGPSLEAVIQGVTAKITEATAKARLKATLGTSSSTGRLWSTPYTLQLFHP